MTTSAYGPLLLRTAGLQHHSEMWTAAGRLLNVWYRRHRDRRLLRGLEERMLKDIGLTRLDAEREAAKFFWER